MQVLYLLQKKGAHFGRELFSETFRLGVNTQLNLTVKIPHNHADIVTARDRSIKHCDGLPLILQPGVFRLEGL